ncbi:MAG: arginyltransferase [Pseudomonadota bacterium]
MSHFERSLRSQFFLTGPRPCPYLDDRNERKLFTNLAGARAEALHDDLAVLGFRRSQNIAYRPACDSCQACVSTRVLAAHFKPTKSQRRVLKRNADLVRRVIGPWPKDAHFRLFKSYLDARHADGGMVDMDALDFAAMIEDSPVRTHLVEYRLAEPGDDLDDAPLLAACVTDALRDGLSLVYSFFDPALERRSLGRYVILDHIAMAASGGLPHVYLGYWVRGSAKMDYKIEFQPSELLVEGEWRAWDTAGDAGTPPR